uniref:Glypican-6 n=1 Tax=Schistocephalus solidus TaxID=70667 RepID=A0A0X3NSH9_SCHSO
MKRMIYLRIGCGHEWSVTLLACVTLFFQTLMPLTIAGPVSDCRAVYQYWNRQLDARMPTSSTRRVDENMCRPTRNNQLNCCTSAMLAKMNEISEQELTANVQAIFRKHAEDFQNDTVLLKSYITEALGTTMVRLHNHFKTDFGYNYEPHKDFFVDFFTTIQSYLFGTRDGLADMVNVFFDELLFRMTQILLNTRINDDLTYVKCVARQLKPQRPFDRAPEIIINLTQEAFPPIRIAINSMAIAHEALLTAAKPVPMSTACTSKYMRLRFCGVCHGFLTVPPCDAACSDLADVCTPQLSALSGVWRDFIYSLRNVLDLLHKFPLVHRPLHMHLTDGIMNLKTVFTRHEQEVLSNCSAFDPSRRGTQPRHPWFSSDYVSSRSKRQASEHRSALWPGSDPGSPENAALTSGKIGNLQLWEQQIQQKYEAEANLFDELGQNICRSSDRPKASSQASCWNGTDLEPASHQRSTRRMTSRPTDPDLQKIESRLRLSTQNLQSVRRSGGDPAALRLETPNATAIRVTRDGRLVQSDKEALMGYLKSAEAATVTASPSPVEASKAATYPGVSGSPDFRPSWPQPVYGAPESADGGSGFYSKGAVGTPADDYANLPVDDEERRLDPGAVGSQTEPPGSPAYQHPLVSGIDQRPGNSGSPSAGGVSAYPTDDEDYNRRFEGGDGVQNSGFPPAENYYPPSQPQPTQPDPNAPQWRRQPEDRPSVYGQTPGLAEDPRQMAGSNNKNPWEREPPEGSGADLPPPVWPDNMEPGYGTSNPPPIFGYPTSGDQDSGHNQWNPSAGGNQDVYNTGLSGLAISEEHEIPPQIWVPESNGVVRMSILPSRGTTSPGRHIFPYLPLLLLATVASSSCCLSIRIFCTFFR